jgi:hypothetical protein
MTRALIPNFTTAVVRITNLARDLPELTGDYDLCFVKLPKRRRGKEYTIRIAPVHLHIAIRSRTITIPEGLLWEMVELEYIYNPLDYSPFLAPLSWLFPQLPAFMAAEELGYIQVIRLREPDQCAVRVSPVMLHLAGPYSDMLIPTGPEDEVFDEFLPVNQVPKKLHICHQSRGH